MEITMKLIQALKSELVLVSFIDKPTVLISWILYFVSSALFICFVMEVMKGSILKTENLGHAISRAERIYRLGMSLSEELVLRLLERCIKEKDIVGGRHVHQLMIGLGLHNIPILAEHLIRLLALSQCFFEANLIFSIVAIPSVFTWHAVIQANVEQKTSGRSFEVYKQMQQDGCIPNKFIYMGVLKACSNLGVLEHGRLLNSDIIRSGLEVDVVIGNTLIDMYAKSGSLSDACKVFDDLSCRDILSWGALLGGYVENGKGAQAIELFERMLLEGMEPNKVIFLCMLKACGGSGALLQGRLLHNEVIRFDLKSDPVISSALVDMYAKCGSLSEAGKVLENSASRCVVSWGALIGGLTQQGQFIMAFNMFGRMQRDGIKPNEFIFSCLVSACCKARNLQWGKFLHDEIIKSGVEADTILGNTLVGMYAECECLMMAQKVFDRLLSRTVVSWSTMISGYTQNGCALDALKLFQRMQQEGAEANMVIYSSILKACSSMGAIELGKLVHHFLLKNELNFDVVVGTTLIELYASCHCLDEALSVFDHLMYRNAVCWAVMISSMAQHGKFRLMGKYLDKMVKQGFKSNAKIFTSIFVSCNQKGKVVEAQQYFNLMTQVHRIVPSTEHIHCIVDLLGRTGHLIKAERLLQSLHIEDDLSGWISLLSACRLHGNAFLGRRCFNHIVSQGYHIGAVYTLMCCIYAEAQMWDEYYQLLKLGKRNKVPMGSEDFTCLQLGGIDKI